MVKHHSKYWIFPFITAFLLIFLFLIPSISSIHAKELLRIDYQKSGKPIEKIEIKLQQQLIKEDSVSFLIKFKKRANTNLAKNKITLQSKSQKLPVKELETRQRKAVIAELKKTANSSQKRVIDYLQEQVKLGNVLDVQPYYIVNGISVTATKEIAEKIATFPEVEKVFSNNVFKLQEMNVLEVNDISLDSYEVEWNVGRVQAPQAWEMRYDGSGTVVAVMDSGVEYFHEALLDKYRGYTRHTGELIRIVGLMQFMEGAFRTMVMDMEPMLRERL